MLPKPDVETELPHHRSDELRFTTLAKKTMKILLAIDDSKFADTAIQATISQVRQDHTQVLVLHVVDWSNFMPSPFPTGGQEPMYSAHQLESIVESETTKAHELVTSAAERLRSEGFDASTSVREGDPKTVILDCATEWRADLIVVGSHGRKGVARFALGSVSEAVARYARCSVEIVRLPSSV
jgi:nucleotide-binding universal stress UspA family protein